MSNVTLNYAQIIDPLSFKSINLAKIYIGEHGTLPNPANASTWKQAYFVNSDGTRTAASQPIRTNAAGYAVDGSGNIKTIQVDGEYSLLVQDQFNATKFSTAKAADIWSDLAGNAGATLIGTSSGMSVQDELSAERGDFFYSTLRAYTGNATRIQIGGRATYFDGGDGVFVRSGSAADNDGTVLKDGLNRSWIRLIPAGQLGDPRWFGLSLVAADNTPIIRATLAAVKSCYLPAGEWPVATQLQVLTNEQLVGDPENSILLANNASLGVVITRNSTFNATQPNVTIRGIRVKGTAQYAFGFTHCTQSTFENLSVAGLTCTNAFIFEAFWNSHFNNLKSNGATVSDAPFLFNKVVLNSEFSALYSSNFSDYSIKIDSSATQISNNNFAGFGGLVFVNATCQGANKYGIYIKQALNLTFSGGYAENCLGILRLDTAQDVMFNKFAMIGTRTGVSTHDLWIGSASGTTSNIVFNGCPYGTIPSVFDSFAGRVAFNQPRVAGNAKFFDKVQRTAATPSSMPISVRDNGGTSSTINVLKTNNLAWKFVEQTISDTGVFTNTVITPAVSAITAPY